MLNKRYKNNGKPLLNLNSVQIEMKKQVDEKVAQGVYKFESVPCCVCQGRDFETLSNKDRYGLYMPTVICRQCGLIQTNPRMNQESYISFYNIEYRKLYGGASPGEDFFQAQYIKGKRIFKYFEDKGIFNTPLPELLILEVGCATGGILKYFRDKGCKVKGIDLDEVAINFGKSKYGLDIFTGTIKDILIEEQPDVILYADVFEHTLFPVEELEQVKRLLSKDGRLYIEVPGVKNLLNSWRDFLGLLQNAHTYHFTLTTLRNLIETHGFKLVIGDESIASVFQRSDATDVAHMALRNDYGAVMTYLKKWEILRRLFPFLPCELKQLPINLIARILKSLRLCNFARKIYHIFH